MEAARIIEKINGFLIEEFEVEPGKITSEANLRETLQLDSLDYIDLVVVIESHFGFKVSTLLTCLSGKVDPKVRLWVTAFLFKL
jgi:acyl carrier protein